MGIFGSFMPGLGDSSSSKRQQYILLLGTTAFFAVAVLALGLWVDYQHYETQMQDRMQRIGRRLPAHPEVVMLAIDSPSLTLDTLFGDDIAQDKTGALKSMKEGWPWPRAVYAPIIDRLAAAGAKVIAFDMMFPTPREGDEQFRAALDRHPDRVIVGATFDERQDERGQMPLLVPPAPSLIPLETGGLDPRVAFVNFRADVDGRVRRALYRTTLLEYSFLPPQQGDPEFYSLAARMAEKGGYAHLLPKTHQPVAFRLSREVNPFSIYEIFVPQFWESPRYASGAVFKDKIVLIGPYGNWSKDTLATPQGMQPGPQIHLGALNAVLRNDFLRESTQAQDIATVLLAGLAAILLGALVTNVVLRSVLLLLTVALGFALALGAFNSVGYLPLLLSPMLTLVSSGFTYIGLERLLEYRERMRVRRTLERYVSKDVVKEVLDNPQSYLNTLGGERRRITVLFSDVRGFTATTENADPAALVKQLNEYFTEMVRIVFAHVGTLDKFMGDAVMATWGVITSRGEKMDASQAVSAGLDMLRALAKLNAGWQARGIEPMKIGLGINHGDAICGNLGSEDSKQEVTAIGDAVNLASRLEGATKEFHVDLLIGDKTAELVTDTFVLRTVDLLKVKGKSKPVEVFTVLDFRDPSTPEPAWLAPYENGVRQYRHREFAEAEQSFLQAAGGAPDDWLIQEYLRRIRLYQAEPPAPEWDGVHTMTSK